MFMTCHTFQWWANKTSKKIMVRTRIEHAVCMVPVSFCAMLRTNGGMYVPEDCVSEKTRLVRERLKKVDILQTRAPDSRLELESQCILAMKAIRREVTKMMSRT